MARRVEWASLRENETLQQTRLFEAPSVTAEPGEEVPADLSIAAGRDENEQLEVLCTSETGRELTRLCLDGCDNILPRALPVIVYCKSLTELSVAHCRLGLEGAVSPPCKWSRA